MIHTQTATVETEEYGLVEVDYQYWPGEPETGEYLYSLGTPAIPPTIEIIKVWWKGKDITRKLEEYNFFEVENALWDISPEDF